MVNIRLTNPNGISKEEHLKAIIDVVPELFYERIKLKEKAELNYQKNKEKYKLLRHKRRALLKGYGGSHSLKEWFDLRNKTNGICPICNFFVGIDKLTKDHIIPLSKGGTDNISNIQPLCKSCNSQKYNKIEEDMIYTHTYISYGD